MEKQTKRNSYLSKELLIYNNIVVNYNVNKFLINKTINDLKDKALVYNNLKKEANKQTLKGQGALVKLSQTRIENAKTLLPIQKQSLIQQRHDILHGDNYTEDMAIAIEQFDNFVAKEYGLYF